MPTDLLVIPLSRIRAPLLGSHRRRFHPVRGEERVESGSGMPCVTRVFSHDAANVRGQVLLTRQMIASAAGRTTARIVKARRRRRER
jgi:hypothetical protein